MFGWGKTVDKIVDGISTNYKIDDKLRAELEKGLREELSKIDQAQLEVNKEEAKQSGLFTKWRPGIGWLCLFALGYHFLAHPILEWVSLIYGIPVPPSVDVSELNTILLGMLGMSTLRTAEKYKGVNHK